MAENEEREKVKHRREGRKEGRRKQERKKRKTTDNMEVMKRRREGMESERRGTREGVGDKGEAVEMDCIFEWVGRGGDDEWEWIELRGQWKYSDREKRW